VSERADDDARKYADGRASFAVRTDSGIDSLVVFDRSAGSERDLVVLAEVAGGVVVQRDRWKVVRVVGAFGVLRWDGLSWHHEPPVATWLRDATAGLDEPSTHALMRLLQFAVHDLGARGIGALLVFSPGDAAAVRFEERLSPPPALRLDRPADLAPLKQVLGQVDGATVFSADGVLTHLGVRIVPSLEAEVEVEPYRGTRHTTARRFSFDDPAAVVVVVSEDGPVTVWRSGRLMGRSEPDD
jgi:DNA integrity scanning protein DisA with diadenylate cyclase activity